MLLSDIERFPHRHESQCPDRACRLASTSVITFQKFSKINKQTISTWCTLKTFTRNMIVNVMNSTKYNAQDGQGTSQPDTKM